METPLHLAVIEGNYAAVEELLKQGADTEALDYEFLTPLAYAVHDEHLDIMQLLIDNNAKVDGPCVEGRTPLILAVGDDKIEALALLIRNGANVNYIAGEMSPLHYAVATCEPTLEIISLLLDNGADLTIKDEYGNTPLELASKWKNWDAHKLIKKHMK